MKLRIKGDSIRIRLTQSEVQKLAEKNSLSDAVKFPGGESFVYRLNLADVAGASMSANMLAISIPSKEAFGWVNSDNLSLDQRIDLADGEHLGILIEKDLQCLVKREGEDESDAFPNPKAC